MSHVPSKPYLIKQVVYFFTDTEIINKSLMLYIVAVALYSLRDDILTALYLQPTCCFVMILRPRYNYKIILVWPTCRTPAVGGLIVCE